MKIHYLELYRPDDRALRKVAALPWHALSDGERRAALQALDAGAREGRVCRVADRIAVQLPDGDVLAFCASWVGAREWMDNDYRRLCELAGKDWREVMSFAFPRWPQYAAAPEGMRWKESYRDGEAYRLVPEDEQDPPLGPMPGALWQPLEEDDDPLGIVD